MSNAPVWIVDDDSSIRWVLQKALQGANIECFSFQNPEDILLQLDSEAKHKIIQVHRSLGP